MSQIPDENRLNELETKWLNGTITKEEAKEYAEWYNNDQELPVRIPEGFARSEKEHRLRMLKNINQRRILEPAGQRSIGRSSVYIRMTRVAAIASVLILGIIGIKFYLWRQARQAVAQTRTPAHTRLPGDIDPGKTRATLTLSNGKTVVLDPTAHGLLDQDNGVNILNKDSVLTYQGAGPGNTPAFNTLTTARGEQYSVTLSDGTRVWLNAATVLRFPVAFTGPERKVEVTGEAYFEVARNMSKPFHVSSANMDIRVLGTSFNVSAYPDERAIETTLLEGSVKINDQSVLSPGQQSRMEKDGRVDIREGIDVDEVVAWKNGAFSFNNADITAVMRQLEKWYDIEVVYEGPKPTDLFFGGISRSSTLLEVLKILQASNVRFRLEGRKLIVLS